MAVVSRGVQPEWEKLTRGLVAIVKTSHEIKSESDSAVEIEDVDELVDELPDNTPRYVLVSYPLTHADGRRSLPLFLVYWIPRTASTELSTLYVCFPPFPLSVPSLQKIPHLQRIGNFSCGDKKRVSHGHGTDAVF